MAGKKDLASYALSLLRSAPRIALNNISHIKGTVKKNRRGRGHHGGYSHGFGQIDGVKKHLNYLPVGYETGNWPFYLRFSREPYYKNVHLKRSYPPISLLTLQKMIDLNRIDCSKPIDLASFCNTGLYQFDPFDFEWGVQLTDEGADNFKAKINIEVQWASEPVIAAVERNGGTICTAFYDVKSLCILRSPKKFFEQGEAIPKRLLPPEDAVLYYSSAASRGYLANPEEISKERLILAQKYGYTLPNIENDPDYEMLTQKKDPRQIFYGLHPGWVVNLKQKIILKPKDEELLKFYSS